MVVAFVAGENGVFVAVDFVKLKTGGVVVALAKIDEVNVLLGVDVAAVPFLVLDTAGCVSSSSSLSSSVLSSSLSPLGGLFVISNETGFLISCVANIELVLDPVAEEAG